MFEHLPSQLLDCQSEPPGASLEKVPHHLIIRLQKGSLTSDLSSTNMKGGQHRWVAQSLGLWRQETIDRYHQYTMSEWKYDEDENYY